MFFFDTICDFEKQWRAVKITRRDEQSLGQTFYKLSGQPKLAPPRKDWRPPEYERVCGLIADIIAKYSAQRGMSIELARAPDGCPYPFDAAFMPHDWSWWTYYIFFSQKVLLQWLYCNGKWVQEDNAETIFVRCLISYCSGKRQGLFGLPINLWALSVIRLAIAHKVHGRALISGIPRESTSLDDWDASRDNMSIETCTENWIKWQFPEEEYPEILQGFKNLQLPKSIYDPSIECDDVGDYTVQDIESVFAVTENQLLDIHGGGVNVVDGDDTG